MFTIITFDYSTDYTRKDFQKWKLPNNYHYVYILENSKDAYIGESSNIVERACRHRKNYEALKFRRIHLITSDIMEETPAKHYEKLLIRLMKVDGLFNIINSMDGYKTHYQRKNEFELHFDKLWTLLIDKGLANKNSFQFILNSNAYKYSPYVTLTKHQSQVITSIKNVLNSKETDAYSKKYKRRPILINGSAGTGKTVVSTSLFHYLKNDDNYKDKKIALVVANEQMRAILQEVFKKSGKGLKRKDVISPIELTKQKYDIIICDETHALRRIENLVSYKRNFEIGNKRLGLDNTHDELDWILCQSEYQILFYDVKQCVKHSDVRDNYIKKRIHKDVGFREIELKSQMRIKAGRSYVTYIYNILYQKIKPERKKTFKNYDFKLCSSFTEIRKIIFEKEDLYQLSKLCSGYAWKWISKKDKSLFDIHIGEEKIRWNNYQIRNWVRSEESKNEMGSLYTLRGIDLNYAGVVIGPDLYFDKTENQIKVNKKSLFSNDVKKGATDEEIKQYVLNIYAVLLTRAIEGTYVYVYDEALREYFKSFIDLHDSFS